ncbi:unnamed protein product [Macrosiphum euphorbiae]|uniref:Uncharacterized protein n=1 Tax=Macrosiphum euphorbiae TaxID=13131 RepID=A0AAV0X186_9HEMI|nr:unnamed protein product [Macrosiphum euphorbiae]
MVGFSGRHQIYDCNQKVFYVSGMRAPAGNGTANQRFPLVVDDEILLYHISTDSSGRGPLYLLGFWLIGLRVSFSIRRRFEKPKINAGTREENNNIFSDIVRFENWTTLTAPPLDKVTPLANGYKLSKGS